MAFNVSADKYSQLISLDAEDRPQYIGETFPAQQRNTGAAVWRIHRIAYDPSGQPISALWAGADNKFNKVWDDRATYNY